MKLFVFSTPLVLAALSLATETLDPSTPAIPTIDATQTATRASDSSSSPTSVASAASSTADPTPLGQLWAPQWTPDSLAPYTRSCAAKHTFRASTYRLKELYPALKPWAAELKVFYNKQHYPGSWAGVDKHGDKRELLKMGLSDVPGSVRSWLKKEKKQKWFSVQDDVVFFAPGVLYKVAPLWVGDEVDSGCHDVLTDLENYSAAAEDGKVLATVEHEKVGKNEVQITVDAFRIMKNTAKSRDEL